MFSARVAADVVVNEGSNPVTVTVTDTMNIKHTNVELLNMLQAGTVQGRQVFDEWKSDFTDRNGHLPDASSAKRFVTNAAANAGMEIHFRTKEAMYVVNEESPQVCTVGDPKKLTRVLINDPSHALKGQVFDLKRIKDCEFDIPTDSNVDCRYKYSTLRYCIAAPAKEGEFLVEEGKLVVEQCFSRHAIIPNPDVFDYLRLQRDVLKKHPKGSQFMGATNGVSCRKERSFVSEQVAKRGSPKFENVDYIDYVGPERITIAAEISDAKFMFETFLIFQIWVSLFIQFNFNFKKMEIPLI